MSDVTTRKEGWANPGVGSQREHYFGADKRSLCGKYAYAGRLYGSPDGPCAACKRKRDAQEKRNPTPTQQD